MCKSTVKGKENAPILQKHFTAHVETIDPVSKLVTHSTVRGFLQLTLYTLSFISPDWRCCSNLQFTCYSIIVLKPPNHCSRFVTCVTAFDFMSRCVTFALYFYPFSQVAAYYEALLSRYDGDCTEKGGDRCTFLHDFNRGRCCGYTVRHVSPGIIHNYFVSIFVLKARVTHCFDWHFV